jgi:DDE superfamily endonuclease
LSFFDVGGGADCSSSNCAHSAKLPVPDNITLLPLPPKSPELNPVENIWQFMRDNWLSNRMDPPDLGQQGAIGHLTRAFGPATPGIISRRRDAHHIAHDANRERLALILDEAEFHLGASEKMHPRHPPSHDGPGAIHQTPCFSVRSKKEAS